MWKMMKKLRRRVIVAVAALAVVGLGCLGFTGCSTGGETEEKVADLEFTVVGERDVPQGLRDLLDQKAGTEFKLTYADGEDLYIVVGAGPQEGGGFSIAVKELYQTENAVVMKTELMGPESGEKTGKDTSCPVLVVKTGYLDMPVVFR